MFRITPESPPTRRYLAAVAIVAAALAIRLLFLGVLGPRIPYATFFPAVIVASLVGGLGAGLFATLLTVLCAAFIDTALLSTSLTAMNLAHHGAFAANGLLCVFITHALVKARVRAVRAESLAELAARDNKAREVEHNHAETFRALFADALDPMGLHLVNEDGTLGHFLEVNPATEKRLGWTREEFKKLTPLDVVSESSRPGILDVVEVLKSEGQAIFETVMLAKDGSTFAAEVNSRLSTYGGNRTLISVVRDISGRKEAEERLRASETRFESVVKLIPVGVYLISKRPGRSLTFDYVSPRFCEILGVDAQDTLNNPRVPFDICHPDDLKDLEQANAQAVEEQASFRWEGRFIVRGETRHIRLESDPDIQPGGVICWNGVVIDLTESRRAEEALRESEARFGNVVRRIPVGVYAVRLRADGFIAFEYVSPQFCAILGLDPVNVLHDAQVAYRAIHHEDFAELIRVNDEAGRNLAPFRFEGRFVVRGETRVIRLESDPEKQPNGDILWNGVVIDLTESRRAEEALRRSEERYRTLFEESVDAITIMESFPPRMVLANSMFTKVFGYTLEEMQALSPDQFAALIHSDDREAALASLKSRMEGKTRTARYRARIYRKDGQLRWVDFSGTRIEHEGEPAVLTIYRDVTESIQAETSLRASEEKYRTLFESAPFGIFRSTPEGRFLDANPAFARMIGFDSPEAVLTGVTDIASQLYLDAGHRPGLLDRALSCQEWTKYENGFRRKDGVVVSGSMSLRAVRNPDGTLACFEGLVEDVTERVRAEAALRESEAKYRELYEGMLDGYVQVDMDGRIMESNAAYRRMLGFSDAEMGQLTYQDITPERWRPFEQAIIEAQVLTYGYSDIYEKEYIRADGSVIPVELRTYLLRGQGGEPRGMWAIVRDASQRQAAEEKLRQAVRSSQEATRAKSEFLANMSHEIRTPLNAILGLTELCRRSPNAEKTAANLGLIADSATNLLGIVGDVLDLSRVEAGRLTLERKTFNLPETLEKVLAPHRENYRQKGLRLVLEQADGLPEWLAGDPVRLGQVLGNLLSNAVKFTEKGGVTVRVGLAASGDTGAATDAGAQTGATRAEETALRFSVADTGVGVPPALREAIFESFRQADSTYSKRYQGVGLGLAICRELTTLMGGRIWVESEPGQGSTFSFTARFGIASPPAQRGMPAPRPALAGKRARVLVAEDNPMNRHVFEEFLAELGMDATCAVNGQEALDRLSSSDFDLVLMDVQMPVVDGVEAVRRIRAGEAGGRAKDIPVIALTAYAMSGDRERFLEAGMTAYLAKPVSLSALAEAVAAFVPPAAHVSEAGAAGLDAPEGLALQVAPGFKPLLGETIAYMRERARAAVSLTGAGDLEGAANAAHDVKGTFMSIGLGAVREQAELLERACREGDADEAKRRSEGVLALLDALELEHANGRD